MVERPLRLMTQPTARHRYGLQLNYFLVHFLYAHAHLDTTTVVCLITLYLRRYSKLHEVVYYPASPRLVPHVRLTYSCV